MDGYLSKPIQPEELFDVVEQQFSVPRVAVYGNAGLQPRGAADHDRRTSGISPSADVEPAT
jgi:hypothetical protein